ncbi:MAG: ribulose-phosphate 3-epimerase [Eubacteriales bacterium]|nr:ribulose-phosphate 3-epimerase [Eubacteriales bacterium]
MNYLAPSVLASDFSKLGEEVKTVSLAGADFIHLDVMDGHFVQNISFGPSVIESLRGYTDALFDVHLMVKEPIRYMERFKKAGADIVTIHYEACEDMGKTLQTIISLGMKAGIAISPDTPVEAVYEYMDLLDMVLVMSVYPGFGGQTFMEKTYERIRMIREKANEVKPGLWIEVDGGVDEHNIKAIEAVGANVFVAGSSVFHGDSAENVKKLLGMIKA